MPKITKNLVNISILTADNHIFIEFHSDFCLVKGKTTKNVLLLGRLKDGLYLLTEPQPTAASQNRKTPRPFTSNSNMSISSYHPNNSCNSVCCSRIVSDDDPNVWHRRLGHPSTRILIQVIKTCSSSIQISVQLANMVKVMCYIFQVQRPKLLPFLSSFTRIYGEHHL